MCWDEFLKLLQTEKNSWCSKMQPFFLNNGMLSTSESRSLRWFFHFIFQYLEGPSTYLMKETLPLSRLTRPTSSFKNTFFKSTLSSVCSLPSTSMSGPCTSQIRLPPPLHPARIPPSSKASSNSVCCRKISLMAPGHSGSFPLCSAFARMDNTA